MHRTVSFKVENEEQRMVFAEVYAPLKPDSDHEFMDAVSIRKMAYKFMRSMSLDSVDTDHDNEVVDGCCVVESFIARKGDPDFIEGAWVVGMHVDNDTTWEMIKKGELNSFSMQALVHKDLVEVEIDLPPVIQGQTMKSEGHAHTFSVAYDDSGKFMGGRTDSQNGHFHAIRRGTATEEANSHTHRFSHMDDISLKEV